MLSFEKLDVYNTTMDFYVLSIKISNSIPKGYGDLADQLRRASLSILNNIAEATGRVTKADQRRFFSIARGSAMESGSIINAAQKLQLCEQGISHDARQLIFRVVSMLSKMSR